MASLIKNIAKEYDTSTTYKYGDYVLYEKVLYMCTAIITNGPFNSYCWEKKYLVDVMDDMKTSEKTLDCNFIAPEYDEDTTYNKDDAVVYTNQLFICKEDEVTGAWDGSKWESSSLVDCCELNSNLGGKIIIPKPEELANYSINESFVTITYNGSNSAGFFQKSFDGQNLLSNAAYSPYISSTPAVYLIISHPYNVVLSTQAIPFTRVNSHSISKGANRCDIYLRLNANDILESVQKFMNNSKLNFEYDYDNLIAEFMANGGDSSGAYLSTSSISYDGSSYLTASSYGIQATHSGKYLVIDANTTSASITLINKTTDTTEFITARGWNNQAHAAIRLKE